MADDVDFEARVQQGFAKQGLMATLGAELVEVAQGRVRISVPFSEGVTQQHGLFHGGVMAALGDTAAGFAGYTLMRDDQQPLAVEFKITFLDPARGERLEARGEVLRSGYRIKHTRFDIVAIAGEQETLVATGLATITATRSVAEKEI